MSRRFPISHLRSQASPAGGTGLARKERHGTLPGFTLVEVLIALSIFAMAAIVLGSAYINVLISYEIASRDTQSDEDVKFARAQLLAIADREKIEDGGDFDSIDGRRMHWSAQIESTSTADLFLVHFLCESNDPKTGEPQKIAQDFYILRPTWSDATEREKLRQDARQRIQKLNTALGISTGTGTSGNSSSSSTKSGKTTIGEGSTTQTSARSSEGER